MGRMQACRHVEDHWELGEQQHNAIERVIDYWRMEN